MMKTKRTIQLRPMVIGTVTALVMSANAWALEGGVPETTQKPVAAQVKDVKTPVDLNVAHKLLFEGGSDVREFALLSETEMKQTQGAWIRPHLTRLSPVFWRLLGEARMRFYYFDRHRICWYGDGYSFLRNNW